MLAVISFGAAIAKIVNLPFKYHSLTIDHAGVKTWFMDHRREATLTQDGVGMFLP